MKTRMEIRGMFWNEYPEFKREWRYWKTQNDYRADIRISFCDFVDRLRRNEEISENEAQSVTL